MGAPLFGSAVNFCPKGWRAKRRANDAGQNLRHCWQQSGVPGTAWQVSGAEIHSVVGVALARPKLNHFGHRVAEHE